ncbi:hypothetical protein ACLOJK_027314 [Asimina triloba]
MASTNPFDLLGDNDHEDLSQLVAVQLQQQKAAPKKAPAATQAASQKQQPLPAKLPSKPLPPTQAGKQRTMRVLAVAEDAVAAVDTDADVAPDSTGTVGALKILLMVWAMTVKLGSLRREGGVPTAVPVVVVAVVADSVMERQGMVTARLGGSMNAGVGLAAGMRLSERDLVVEIGELQLMNYRLQYGSSLATSEYLGLTIVMESVLKLLIGFFWGREAEDVVNATEKNLSQEQQPGEEDSGVANKEGAVTEPEEKEPEEKEMTLDEYEKILEEKRKALQVLKTQERKVDLDKELKSMQQLSSKKSNEDVFIKLASFIMIGSEKDKRKDIADKEEKNKKSPFRSPLSINEFLKPAEGEKYYSPSGRGRGGRGSRGGFSGGNLVSNNAVAPSIEDPGRLGRFDVALLL